MLLGAGLSLMTIVVSYLVLLFAFRNVKQIQMLIVLGGFVVRVAMLFGLLALIARTLVADLNQLVIWLVSFYLVLVVAEAWELASETRERRPPEA
ncbi:MAG: hypothetical protein ACE5G2_08350 [Candidatus Krumholzibacteriia bacterium]